MADELTPGQVRTRQFDVVRKGYERGQVEQFLAELGGHIEVLQSELEASSRAGIAIGIDEQEALALELHTIGGDVAEILEAARSAAEGIRSRASQDADEWRTAAENESAGMVVDATEQTQSLRASAWNEGSSLLSSASAEAQSIVATAKEEALFVRAEAEREAIRLTGDAKRDREEIVRAARAEAEQVIDTARSDSEAVLAAAGQQAELAQERARALEDRRSELLAELEATRASIGELESEIESRKLEMEAPEEPEEVADDPDSRRTHHTSDGGSVKIVAPTRVVPMRPVDAEELVAEVTALRAGEVAVQAEGDVDPTPLDPSVLAPPAADPGAMEPPPSESTEEEPLTAVTSEIDPSDDETTDIEEALVADIEVDEPVEPSKPDVPDVVAEDDRQAEAPAEGELSAPVGLTAHVQEPIGDAPLPAAPEPGEPGGDDLGSLFAQLRETPTGQSTPDTTSPLAATDDALPAIPKPSSIPPQPKDRPVASTAGVVTQSHEADAATLIPLQNTALRSIKRTLVDLQNEALEHLRTDSTWMPDEAFTDRFEEAFAELTFAVSGEADTSSSSAFGTDLYDAVSSAMERSRDAGAGERELAAATSKVFRTWRSDEAERRVADVVAVGRGGS